jgi:hypothetical protein
MRGRKPSELDMSSSDRPRARETSWLLEPSNLLEPLDLSDPREVSGLHLQPGSATAYALFGNAAERRSPPPPPRSAGRASPSASGPGRNRRPGLWALGAVLCFAAGATLPMLTSISGAPAETADPPKPVTQKPVAQKPVAPTPAAQTASAAPQSEHSDRSDAAAVMASTVQQPTASAGAPSASAPSLATPDPAPASSRVAVREQPTTPTENNVSPSSSSFWQSIAPAETRTPDRHPRRHRHLRPPVQDQTVGQASADQAPAANDQQPTSAKQDTDDMPRRTRHARSRAHDRTTDQAVADQQPASANDSSASSPRADQQDPSAGRQASNGQSHRDRYTYRGDRPYHRNAFFSFLWGGGR